MWFSFCLFGLVVLAFWGTLASILTTLISVGSLAYWLGRKFGEIDERFKLIDERFRLIDERFRQIDEGFKSIDERFKQIDERFKEIDKRFERIDRRFEEIDRRFNELREYVDSRFNRLIRSFTSLNQTVYSTLIDFMTLKGIFTEEERRFLVREIERLTSAYGTNPLKPEEVRFILEVMKEIKEKDPKEIDLRKLDKILEIADRLIMENGTREAAELWFKVYALKAILRKEKGEY